MVLVGLYRVRRVPLAWRKTAYPGQRLAPCALALGLVEQLGEIRVGIDDADEIRYRAHVSTASRRVATDARNMTISLPRPSRGSPELGLWAIARE